MLQEGGHGDEFDAGGLFSAFYFFNAGHESMHPEEEHPQLELQNVVISHKIQDSSLTGFINNSWILLDNHSTVRVFYESRLQKDIWKIDSWLDIHFNFGIKITN